MKARPMKHGDSGLATCEPSEATHIALYFPGPSGIIFLPVLPPGRHRKGTGCWTWNGSTDRPTLKPSVRTRGGDFLCHSFVTDGMVQFLLDSSHELKGRREALLDVDAVLGDITPGRTSALALTCQHKPEGHSDDP